MKSSPHAKKPSSERDSAITPRPARSDGSDFHAATPQEVIEPALRTTGEPLDHDVRMFMEPKLGHSFENVRVHADEHSINAAAALGAKAFTVGDDVVLGGHGQAHDRRLIAHELTHVAQQRDAARPAAMLSSPSDASEREASWIADQLSRGATVDPPSVGPSALIHRDVNTAPPPAAPPAPAGPTPAPEADPKLLAEEEQRAYDAVAARAGYPAAEVRFNTFATADKPELEIFNIGEIVQRPAAEPKRLGFDSEGAARVFASNVSKDTGAVVIKQDKFYFVTKVAKGNHVLRTKSETFLDESKVTGFGDAAKRSVTFDINFKWFGSHGADKVYFVHPYNQIVAVASIEGMFFPLLERLEPDAGRMAFQTDPATAKPPDAADLRAFAGIVPDGKQPEGPPKIPDQTEISEEQQETFIDNYFRARGLESLNENEKMVDKLAEDFAPAPGANKDQKGSGVSEKAKALIDASRVIGASYKNILDREARFNADVDYIETVLKERRRLMGEEEAQKPIMLVVNGKAKSDFDWRRELKGKQDEITAEKNSLLSKSPLLAQLVERDPKGFTNEWADMPSGKVHLGTLYSANPYDQSLLGKPATAENDEKIRDAFAKKLDNVRKAVRRARAEIVGGDLDTLLSMDGLQRRVKADFSGMAGKNASLKPRLDKIIDAHQIKEMVWTVAEMSIQVGLLFVPGGQFLSAAVGFASAVRETDKNLTNWTVSQASLDPTKALVDQQAAEQALAANTLQLVISAIDLGQSTIGALNALDGGTKVVKPPSTIEPPNAKPPEAPTVDPSAKTAVDPNGQTHTAPPPAPQGGPAPPGTVQQPATPPNQNPMAQSAPAPNAQSVPPPAPKPGEPPAPAVDPNGNPTFRPGTDAAPPLPSINGVPAPQFTPLPLVIMEDQFVKKEFSSVLPKAADAGQAEGKLILENKHTNKQYLLKPAGAEKEIAATHEMGIPPGQRARRAPAAAMVGDKMGMVTPKADLVLFEGKIYSMQEWIPNAKSLKEIYTGYKAGDPAMSAMWKEIMSSQAAKDMDAFQYMIGGLDANYGNFIVELDEAGKFKRLVPIDMDASLPPTAMRFTPVPELNGKPLFQLPQAPLPETVSKEFDKHLRHMAANRGQLSQALGYYLADAEIKGLLARVDEIIAKIDSGAITVM
jgi:hypothetical protein